MITTMMEPAGDEQQQQQLLTTHPHEEHGQKQQVHEQQDCHKSPDQTDMHPQQQQQEPASQKQTPNHHQDSVPPQQPTQQTPPETNGGAPSRQAMETRVPALVQVKQEPVDDQRDCYTPNHAVSAALAEAMTMKFSMPRHRYTTMKPSSSPDPSVCEVCQAEFPTPQMLQPHKLCHFNTCHVCYVCDTYFTHADTMTLHMATIHRNLNPTGQALNDDGREWFICPVCLQRFATNTGLSKHQTSHVATESNFGCRVCGLDFVGSRALMAHLSSSRHNEMKVKMQGVFVCVECRSIFASRDAYAMHMMLRAQTETCPGPESRNVINTRVPTPNKADVLSPESHSDTSVTGSSSKPPSRSSSVIATSRNNSPLNLTTTPPLMTQQHPGFVKPAYTCAKCLATFANQEAMAVHLVMHSAMEKGQEFRLSNWGATRPNSAPVGVMHPDKGHSPWMCGRCLVAFDTCDTLAMHMMTKHANESEGERSATIPVQTTTNYQPHLSPQAQMTVGSVARNEELMAKLANLHNGHFGKRVRRSSVQSNESDPLPPKRCKSSSDAPNPSWFECPACKQMFSARMEWYKHVLVCSQQQEQQRHHQPSDKDRQTPNGQPEVLECQPCNMVFADDHSMSAHYQSQLHKDRLSQQVICQYCNWAASDHQALTAHMAAEHNGDSERTDRVTSSGRESSIPEADTPPGIREVEPDNASPGGDPPTTHREVPLNLVCGDRQDMEPEYAGKGFPPGESSVALQQLIDRCDPDRSTTPKALPGSTTSGTSGVGSSAEDSSEGDIIDYVLTHAKDLAMCKYCKIVYTDKTLYCLHMGLHNLNNPWQCNMCGKVCHDIHEFTSHVIHF